MMIDLWFPVTGQTLPSDHGYPMYGALCRVVPELHEAADWGLHTLRGRPMGPGIIGLPPGSRLGLRAIGDSKRYFERRRTLSDRSIPAPITSAQRA